MKFLIGSLIGLALLASGCATATYVLPTGRAVTCRESAFRVAADFHDSAYASCKTAMELAGGRRLP